MRKKKKKTILHENTDIKSLFVFKYIWNINVKLDKSKQENNLYILYQGDWWTRDRQTDSDALTGEQDRQTDSDELSGEQETHRQTVMHWLVNKRQTDSDALTGEQETNR